MEDKHNDSEQDDLNSVFSLKSSDSVYYDANEFLGQCNTISWIYNNCIKNNELEANQLPTIVETEETKGERKQVQIFKDVETKSEHLLLIKGEIYKNFLNLRRNKSYSSTKFYSARSTWGARDVVDTLAPAYWDHRELKESYSSHSTIPEDRETDQGEDYFPLLNISPDSNESLVSQSSHHANLKVFFDSLMKSNEQITEETSTSKSPKLQGSTTDHKIIYADASTQTSPCSTISKFTQTHRPRSNSALCYQSLSSCTQTSQSIPNSAQSKQSVSGSIQASNSVSNSAHSYPSTSNSAHSFLSTSNSAQSSYQSKSSCNQISLSTPNCAQASQSASNYAQVSQSASNYAQASQSASNYAQVSQSASNYAQASQSTSNCTQTSQSVSNCAQAYQSISNFGSAFLIKEAKSLVLMNIPESYKSEYHVLRDSTLCGTRSPNLMKSLSTGNSPAPRGDNSDVTNLIGCSSIIKKMILEESDEHILKNESPVSDSITSHLSEPESKQVEIENKKDKKAKSLTHIIKSIKAICKAHQMSTESGRKNKENADPIVKLSDESDEKLGKSGRNDDSVSSLLNSPQEVPNVEKKILPYLSVPTEDIEGKNKLLKIEKEPSMTDSSDEGVMAKQSAFLCFFRIFGRKKRRQKKEKRQKNKPQCTNSKL